MKAFIGTKYRGATTSMVERETKLTILVLLDGLISEATREGIIRRLAPHKKYVLTLTSDNGKEFSGYAGISEKLGSAIYFCMPYHSWERGLNENTNGLLGSTFTKARILLSQLQQTCNAKKIYSITEHVKHSIIIHQ